MVFELGGPRTLCLRSGWGVGEPGRKEERNGGDFSSREETTEAREHPSDDPAFRHGSQYSSLFIRDTFLLAVPFPLLCTLM